MIEALKGYYGAPVFSGTLTDGSGKTYAITAGDFVQGGSSLKEAVTDGQTLAPGTAVMRELDAVLYDKGGKFAGVTWKGASIALTVSARGGKTTASRGVYYVATHTRTAGKITVRAYDKMKILEQEYVTDTLPETVSALVSSIAAAAGLTVSGLPDAVGALTVPAVSGQITKRQALANIAQMAGKWCRVDGSVLTFDWFNFDTTYAMPALFSHSYHTADTTYTGATVTGSSSSVSASAGTTTDASTTYDASNEFLTTADGAALAAGNVSAAVCHTFRAGSLSVLSWPAIEAGDILTGTDDTGAAIVVPVMQMTLKNGSTQMNIESNAPDEDTKDLRYSNAQRYIARAVAGSLAKQAGDTNTDFGKAVSDAAKSAAGSAGGYSGGFIAGGKDNQYGKGYVYSYKDNGDKSDSNLLRKYGAWGETHSTGDADIHVYDKTDGNGNAEVNARYSKLEARDDVYTATNAHSGSKMTGGLRQINLASGQALAITTSDIYRLGGRVYCDRTVPAWYSPASINPSWTSTYNVGEAKALGDSSGNVGSLDGMSLSGSTNGVERYPEGVWHMGADIDMHGRTIHNFSVATSHAKGTGKRGLTGTMNFYDKSDNHFFLTFTAGLLTEGYYIPSGKGYDDRITFADFKTVSGGLWTSHDGYTD